MIAFLNTNNIVLLGPRSEGMHKTETKIPCLAEISKSNLRKDMLTITQHWSKTFDKKISKLFYF